MNPLPATDPTLAVTYRRVSGRDQAEHGYGLDAQAAALGAFVQREGLTVVGAFVDPGVSGTTPLDDRPGLSAALDRVLATGSGALLVARHDRLARDTLQALLIERAFMAAGARVLFADGGNGISDSDRFTRTILHAAAEAAKRETVRRLAAGRVAKAARDPRAYVGGRPPFGYLARNGALVPHPQEGPVVRSVFDMARRGHSTRAIAGRMGWAPTKVARILAYAPYKQGPPGTRIVDPKLWNAAAKARQGRRKQPE
ncbi:MAG: recombinase family protein [Thermoleophilaceae bacterium]